MVCSSLKPILLLKAIDARRHLPQKIFRLRTTFARLQGTFGRTKFISCRFFVSLQMDQRDTRLSPRCASSFAIAGADGKGTETRPFTRHLRQASARTISRRRFNEGCSLIFLEAARRFLTLMRSVRAFFQVMFNVLDSCAGVQRSTNEYSGSSTGLFIGNGGSILISINNKKSQMNNKSGTTS